jgi:uncharacterized protein
MPVDGVGNAFYFDPMYLLFLAPAILLSLWAQSRVQGAYNKWSKVRNSRNMTGADVAQTLLPKENMGNVQVELTQAKLSDHYDPSHDILRLSPEVAQQPTIAAMSVAAHEIGHAEQDRDNYIWMNVRSGIVPFIQIGSTIGYLVFIAGLMMQINILAWVGIFLFSAGAIFALITLPVELNASNRAMRMLSDNGLIQNNEEFAAARDMLNAAALTYVAAAAQAVMQILYYVFVLLGSRSRQRDNY